LGILRSSPFGHSQKFVGTKFSEDEMRRPTPTQYP
jgi:hypothetical protein